MAQDRPDEVLALLQPLLPRMEQRGRTDLVIEIQILRALAFRAQGNIGQALTALESALSLAEPGGYVRMFVDEGEPMAKVLMMRDQRLDASDSATYEIRVQGRLNEEWSDWLDGLTITFECANDGSPVTTLTGAVADQCALRGILSRIWDLNLTLISVNRIEVNSKW